MADKLVSARELAKNVRFCKDIEFDSLVAPRNLHSLTSFFHQSSLAISQEVTPQLFECLSLVSDRLNIPADVVEAFVYPSAELQAECFNGSKHEFVLRFSSALVEKLSAEEFCFVAGHEVGHFLFAHGLAENDSNSENLEYFINRRYQEISADRLGLLACESLDVALKAIMKTASGLSSKHLRFDVNSYISQIKKVQTQLNYDSVSHPSLLVRSRALLWFSLNDLDKLRDGSADSALLNKLDEKIIDDFSKYIDGPVNAGINEAANNLKIWLTAAEILERNVYSKIHQYNVEQYFGHQIASSLRNYLSGGQPEQLRSDVKARITHAEHYLQRLAPYSFVKRRAEAQEWLTEFMG